MDDPVDVNALILKTNNLKVQCENLLQAFSIKMWVVESRYKTDLMLAGRNAKFFLADVFKSCIVYGMRTCQ